MDNEAREAKRLKFVRMYEDHWPFHARGDKEEQTWWWQIVDKVGIMDLERWFEIVKELHDRRSSPRRDVFKQAAKRLIPQKSYADMPPTEECHVCYGSGAMTALGRLVIGDDGRERFEISVDPCPGPLTRVAVACFCTKGVGLVGLQKNEALRARIFRWRREELPSLAKASGKYDIGTPEKWFEAEIYTRSHRLATESRPVAPAPVVATPEPQPVPEPVESLSEAPALPGGYTEEEVPF